MSSAQEAGANSASAGATDAAAAGMPEEKMQQLLFNAMIVVAVLYLCSNVLFAKKADKGEDKSNAGKPAKKSEKKAAPAPAAAPAPVVQKPTPAPVEAKPTSPAAPTMTKAERKQKEREAKEAAKEAKEKDKEAKEKESKDKARANKHLSKSSMAKQLAAEVKMLKEQLEASNNQATTKGSASASASGASDDLMGYATRTHDAGASDDWETVSTKMKKPSTASMQAAAASASASAASSNSTGVVGMRDANKPSAGTFMSTMSSSSTNLAAKSAAAASAYASAVAAANAAAASGAGADAPAAPAAPVVPAVPTCDQVIMVPGRKIGIIIGPKGSTLHHLQDTCNVLIQISKEPASGTGDAAMVPVNVSGNSPASVSKVVRGIQDLVTKGYSALTANLAADGTSTSTAAAAEGGGANNPFMERSMQVPNRFLPDIIGKGGATVRELQSRTGAKVTVTNDTNIENDIKFSRLTFGGFKSQVNEAKAVVREIMKYFHSDLLNPDMVHVELTPDEVPPEMYNVLIGTKGSEIKHIQGNFKVALHIPHGVQGVECLNNNLVLVGAPSNVDAAVRYINKLVANVNARNAERGARVSSGGGAGAEVEEPLEPWMMQYVRPSRHAAESDSTSAWGSSASTNESQPTSVVWEDAAADTEEASSASASAAATTEAEDTTESVSTAAATSAARPGTSSSPWKK